MIYALSLTDQAIAFGNGLIEEATVRQMLGSVDRSHVYQLIEALAHGDGKTVVETSEVLRLNGLSAASTLEEMSAVLQRMAVLQAVPGQIDDSDPESADLVRLAGLMPADETQLLYSLCLHGLGELGLAPDEYAALTMVLLRLLAFKPASAAAPVVEKKTLNRVDTVAVAPSRPVETHSTAPTPTSAPTTALVPSAPVNLPPPGQVLHVVDQPAHANFLRNSEGKPAPDPMEYASEATKGVVIPVRVQAESRAESLSGQAVNAVLIPSEEGDFWHPTVQQLIADEAIIALARELALQSQLVARDTDQWILRVERESLNQSGSCDRLQAALQNAGHSVKLLVEIGRVTDSPARRNAAAAAQRQLAAEKIIFEDPFVQTMMRDFGAKIVPGSIKPA